MRDRINPLSNVIEFTGQKGWVAKTNSVMNELQGSLSELEAFNECYLVFSPKKITPANRKDYENRLVANVVDKLAECKVMLDGLSVMFGEEQVARVMVEKGRELFQRYEEELSNCIAVTEYMKEFGRKLNGKSNQKPV